MLLSMTKLSFFSLFFICFLHLVILTACSNPLGSSSAADVAFLSTSQIFSDTNNTSSGFGAGTSTGILWDGTGNNLRLSQTGSPTNLSNMDSTWAPEWNNLIAYYPFNGDFNDYSGHGLNGTAQSGLGFTSSCHIGNSCASFDGVSNYFSVASNPVFQLNTSYTISMWIHPNTWPGYGGLMSKGDGNGTGWFIWIAGTTAIFDRATQQYGVTVPNSTWTLLTYSMNAVTNTLTIYENAVQISQQTVVNTTVTDTSNFEFSRIYSSAGFAASSVSELAFWSVPLTSKEIQTLYDRQAAAYSGTFLSRAMDSQVNLTQWLNFTWTTTLPFIKELPDSIAATPSSETSSNYSHLVGDSSATTDNNLMTGIVGLWHLDEAANTTGASSVLDRSGTNAHGTPSNVTFGVGGRFGTAASFNGTNSFISIPNISLTGSVSVSVWFNTTNNGQNGFLVGKDPVNANWELFFEAGYLKWRGGDNGNYLLVTPPTAGQWHHAVATQTGTTANIYVDGKLAGTTGVAIAIGNNTGTLNIGRFNSAYYFNGLIDEVAVRNKVLNASEALELYRRGANRIKYQIRTCASSGCSDAPKWIGPDGTNQSYFTELNNNVAPSVGSDLTASDSVQAGLPILQFANFSFNSVSLRNRYFQYRAIFESDDTSTSCNYGSGPTWCSPELQAVTAAAQP
jgi:hypothetical protein